MSEVLIDVKNVSKYYQLGTIGIRSFKQDLKQWWLHSFKKSRNNFFDPKNETGIRICALDNVSLKLHKGDILGVIGENGSGKSTLLKIISRVIHPSEGTVSGRGNISSLLEVGAGFHQELTGRDNIFLSGCILGMSKRAVSEKLDEIVDFSDISQFIDTPVKRYSSGMYLRLAFAIGAILESDILIIDEILAVADQGFQHKCLAKIIELAQTEGKAVLIVNHNMDIIERFCTKALWLDKGNIKAMGCPDEVVPQYLRSMNGRG